MCVKSFKSTFLNAQKIESGNIFSKNTRTLLLCSAVQYVWESRVCLLGYLRKVDGMVARVVPKEHALCTRNRMRKFDE
jgi:hypothetical protein